MESYDFQYRLTQADYVNAMLFISFSSNGSLKKSRIRICLIGAVGLLFGISRLVKNSTSLDMPLGIMLTSMGLYLIFYGIYRVKAIRFKMMNKSVERFHSALFEGTNQTTITKDLITERTLFSYLELKKEIFRAVYELKDSFVFLTTHGSISVIPNSAITNLELFRSDIKEWYDYENHYQWAW